MELISSDQAWQLLGAIREMAKAAKLNAFFVIKGINHLTLAATRVGQSGMSSEKLATDAAAARVFQIEGDLEGSLGEFVRKIYLSPKGTRCVGAIGCDCLGRNQEGFEICRAAADKLGLFLDVT
jgi:hypothetical protein